MIIEHIFKGNGIYCTHIFKRGVLTGVQCNQLAKHHHKRDRKEYKKEYWRKKTANLTH